MSKKKIKNNEFKFHVINIKIHSDLEDKQDLYKNAFKRIFELDKFYVNIGNKNGLGIKTIESTLYTKNQLDDLFLKFQYEKYEILRGEFIKFRIEDENDKYYNIKEKNIKDGNPNSEIKPNAHIIPFIFIPSIHRLLLPLNSKLSPIKVKIYLEKALLELFPENEYFNVEISKSIDEVNRIYNFIRLDRLELNISYTNDDLGDDEKMFVDELLKKSRVNKFKASYQAERNESLNIDSMLIKGGIELSKENGELKAVGYNKYGVKEVVNTYNKFEQFSITFNDVTNSLISILKESLRKWRK